MDESTEQYAYEPFLKPLAQYTSQYELTDERGIPLIGSFQTNDEQAPVISHDAFVSQHLPKLLPVTVERYGRVAVLSDLAGIAIPAYDAIPPHHMAVYWRSTVEGRNGYDGGQTVPPGLSYDALATQYGVNAIFSPIIELALSHQECLVFDNTGKFFNTHAQRMGHVITRFGLENYRRYIKLARRLLQHDVYDWSAELSPDQWDTLAPAIEKFHFAPTLSPMIEAMCLLGHIPGTKDEKYKFSFLGAAIWGMMPYLLPRLMDGGPGILQQDLAPIIQFVETLYAGGAFKKGSSWTQPEGKFFKAFGDHLALAQEKGMQAVIDAMADQSHWQTMLVPKPA